MDDPKRPTGIDWSREFSADDLATWHERVRKELKGRDPASLAHRFEDGFSLAPLQTEADTPHLAHLATGADALLRARAPGTLARQRIVGPAPEDAADQLRRALEDGVDEIELDFDVIRVRRGEPLEPEAGDEERGDASAGALFADLPADVFESEGALPEPRSLVVSGLPQLADALAPLGFARGATEGAADGPVSGQPVRIALRAGAATPAVVAGLSALADRVGGGSSTARAHLRGLEAGYDPIGLAARGELEGAPLDAHWTEAADLVHFMRRHVPDGRALGLDASPFHAAGASPAQELAALLCGGLETLRRLGDGSDEARTLDPATVAAHLTFRLPLTTEPLVEAARLRALRLLWARVLATTGLDPSIPALAPKVVGTTSARTRAATIDLRTNLVRTAIQAFGGFAGGCDALCVLPDTLDAAALHAQDHHTARGQVHLLREEAALGRVVDPLGGSHTIERLTDALGRAAWDLIRAIEAEGGLGAPGGRRRLAEEIRRAAQKRADAIRRRERVLVGLSRYADPEREDVRRRDGRVEVAERAAHAWAAARSVDDGLEIMAQLAAVESAHAASGGTVEASMVALVAGATFTEVLRARREQALVPKPDEHGCSSADPWPLHPGTAADGLPFEIPRLLARTLAAEAGADVVRVRVAMLEVHGDDARTARARAGFAEDLWRVAGAEVVPSPTGIADVETAVAAVRGADASLVCLCAPDATLDALVEPLASALAGLTPPVDLYVAAAPRPNLDRFVSRFLHRSMDVVDFLDEAWVEQLARQAGQSLDEEDDTTEDALAGTDR